MRIGVARLGWCIAGGMIVLAGVVGAREQQRGGAHRVGVNPRPVHLVRPSVAPLTPMARLGRELFFDSTLSASGHLSCASCHSPAHAYASPGPAIVQSGGVSGHMHGSRAVPSLRYVDRTPPFSIGPAVGESDAPKAPVASPASTPRGGLFWDGRASTLQSQAVAPLLNPAEMANRSIAAIAARLRPKYRHPFAELLGEETVGPADRFVAEAAFAIARFELEDLSFHPYDSKYDAYLEGRAALTPAEARGLALFEDPARGNCAACHLDRPAADGRPPVFSDFEYEALGVPRNRAVAAPVGGYDLGLCGPTRTDLAGHAVYCGMFRTPSLRNVAVRSGYFHNGVARTLDDVMRFYMFRDTRPELVFGRDRSGAPARFDDLPVKYRRNVDTVDRPFNRKQGDAPALSSRDMQDIVAFLRTLTDGYRAPSASIRDRSSQNE